MLTPLGLFVHLMGVFYTWGVVVSVTLGRYVKHGGRLFALVLATALLGGCDWIVLGCAASSQVNRRGYCISNGALEAAAEALPGCPVFFEHNRTVVVGRVEAAAYSPGIILVALRISKTQPRVWFLVREGMIRGLSLAAFSATKEVRPGLPLRYSRIEPLEVSLTTAPADRFGAVLDWYRAW